MKRPQPKGVTKWANRFSRFSFRARARARARARVQGNRYVTDAAMGIRFAPASAETWK
jgi:hypothetical protein